MADSLGADIRALRKSKSTTLQELADCLGKSVGWMSQIERNLSSPSNADLRAIADALQVPLSLLFASAPAESAEQGVVVRQGSRRQLGTSDGPLQEELLSPDLTDDFEMILSTFSPRSDSGTVRHRDTQELAYMISGTLEIEIGEKTFVIGPGDSIRIRKMPYRWANKTDEPALMVWVVSPPVY